MASNVPRSTICFDKENPSTQIHKIKDASSKRFQKGSKRVRTVLGSVSNFSNVRVQPSRAVKSAVQDGVGDENSGIVPKCYGRQHFGVYIDPPASSYVSMPSQARTLSLHQQQQRAPLQSLSMADQNAESHYCHVSRVVPDPHNPPHPLSQRGGCTQPLFSERHHHSVQQFCAFEGNRTADANDVCIEDEVVQIASSASESEEMVTSSCKPQRSDRVDCGQYWQPGSGTFPPEGHSVKMHDREVYLHCIPPYSEDIYRYLLTMETACQPQPGFMRRQKDITVNMRAILMDWLVEVGEEYKLQRETLFLTVNYIDRFLSRMAVQRSKLQLLGAAAMFLAAKYEEIYPPDVTEFVYITDDTYTKKQILKMEFLLLKQLEFNVATPTINWFAERLVRKIDGDEDLYNLTMYICELVLVEQERFFCYKPSLMAASALCLARHTLLYQNCWTDECIAATLFRSSFLQKCVCQLQMVHLAAPGRQQQAVQEKYRSTKFGKVSDIQPSAQAIDFRDGQASGDEQGRLVFPQEMEPLAVDADSLPLPTESMAW